MKVAKKKDLLTTIVILIYGFQPADIIMSMRDKMHVDETLLADVTCLQEHDMFCLTTTRYNPN